MQVQTVNTGYMETANAQKYLLQLCKHFGHKVPASVEGNQGRITFDFGEVILTADDDRLTATLSGIDDEALPRMRRIVDDHLKRFAFREEFDGMTWDAVS